MEDMTVQVVSASTEVAAPDADCERGEASRAIPSQDTPSSNAVKETEPSTDRTVSESQTESNRADARAATYLPIYKGRVCPVDASDTKEITTLLQLGMKQREMQPLMEELQMLASQCGAKSIKELVERSRAAYDEQALKDAVAVYGEQEGRALFEREREQRRRLVPAPTDEQAAMHERLAQEFIELRNEFADYTGIAQLPESVLETAMTQNIHLMDALLRFEHQERRRAQAEQRAQKQNASRTGGSLQQAADSRSSTAMDAFLRGLHRRV